MGPMTLCDMQKSEILLKIKTKQKGMKIVLIYLGQNISRYNQKCMCMFQIIDLRCLASPHYGIFNHILPWDSYNIHRVLAVCKPILFLMNAISCLPGCGLLWVSDPASPCLYHNVVYGTQSGMHECGMSHPPEKEAGRWAPPDFVLLT